MNHSQTFDDVLDQCLADLRARRTTPDACLRAHPDIADELAPLLAMALAVEGAADVQPAPSFVRNTRARLLHGKPPLRVTRREQLAHAFFPLAGARLRLAAMALALVVLMLLTGGTLYAANDSLPGSGLYPLKRGVENWQLTLSRNGESRARLLLTFAERRLNESLVLLRAGQTDLAAQSASEYQSDMQQVLALNAASPNAALNAQVRDELLQQQAQVQSAGAGTNGEVLAALRQTVNASLQAVSTPTPTATSTATMAATNPQRTAIPSTTQPATATSTATNAAASPSPAPTATPLVIVTPNVVNPPDVPATASVTSVPALPTIFVVPNSTPAPPTATRTPVSVVPTVNVPLPTLVPTLPPATIAPTLVPPTSTSVPPTNTAVPATATRTPTPIITLPPLLTNTPIALPSIVPTIRLP